MSSTWTGMGLSAFAHVALYSVLGGLPLPVEARVDRMDRVEFEVIEETPPKLEPVEPTVGTPEPEPEPPKPRPRPRVADKEPPPPAPKTAPEPVSFDNVTLTNDDGEASWAIQKSTGLDSSRLLASANSNAQPGGEPGGTGKGRGRPGPVSLGNLSRRPEPPSNMNARLTKNYPPQARQQGVEATVLARVTVRPSGQIGAVSVTRESIKDAGFGKACIKTLRATRWSPPLDVLGNPVTTIIKFECRFTVR